jgi:hypothetical protein
MSISLNKYFSFLNESKFNFEIENLELLPISDEHNLLFGNINFESPVIFPNYDIDSDSINSNSNSKYQFISLNCGKVFDDLSLELKNFDLQPNLCALENMIQCKIEKYEQRFQSDSLDLSTELNQLIEDIGESLLRSDINISTKESLNKVRVFYTNLDNKIKLINKFTLNYKLLSLIRI